VGTISIRPPREGYSRYGYKAESVDQFARICEFFDLTSNDPDWDKEKIGVEIFSLVPPEVRATKAFQLAMAPFLKLMNTSMKYL